MSLRTSGDGGRSPLRYEDFAVRIEPAEDNAFRARALESSGGGASTRFELPFPPSEVSSVLASIEAEVRRGRSRDVVPFPESAAGGVDVREIGDMLYRSLFSGGVRDAYLMSQGRVDGDPHVGLRLRLVVDPGDARTEFLCGLPWELLFRKESHRFLSQGHLTPIVRHLAVPWPSNPTHLPFTEPLRILVLTSDPGGPARLDLDREKELILESWSGQVSFMENATFEGFRRRLRDVEPHILHFMGHGTFTDETGEGALVFEAIDGSSNPIRGAELAVALQDVNSLALALLNACDSGRQPRQRGLNPYGGVAAALIRGGLPAVVAMQFPISDEASIRFSRGFYGALAAGDPVDAAVAEGRQAIHGGDPSSYEWAIPVLYLKTPEAPSFRRSTAPIGNQSAWKEISPDDLLLITREIQREAVSIRTGDRSSVVHVTSASLGTLALTVPPGRLEDGHLAELSLAIEEASMLRERIGHARKIQHDPYYLSMSHSPRLQELGEKLASSAEYLRSLLMVTVEQIAFIPRSRAHDTPGD